MIMELFYKKYDFDEQVATFNILCYDLIRLKQDVQTVINRLRTQSGEALSKLADIFQEVVDYCTVFVTRIEMIFDNRTITTQKDLGDVGDQLGWSTIMAQIRINIAERKNKLFKA